MVPTRPVIPAEGSPPAIFLMGPTASGKTDLAVRLAEQLPLEVISVDSALVYRGMDIGTAKPEAEVLARAPHRLIDVCDPSEAYSAARFREDALREMGEILDAGRIPLLVGGTMLYFNALEYGLSDLPSANPEIRARLARELERVGSVELHGRLSEVDPQAAERIHPNDPQRILRALEVYEATDRPLSDWHRKTRDVGFNFNLLKLIYSPVSRDVLWTRIEARFRKMLDSGFEDEVRRLMERGDLEADLPAMRAVGYRQMVDFLSGRCTREEMADRAIIATRQLAKRQMTWLRSVEDGIWLTADAAAHHALERATSFCKAFPKFNGLTRA